MSGIVIASQLPEVFNARLAARIPEAQIIAVPAGAPVVTPGVQILIVGGIRGEGTHQPPPGWPFDLAWIQLVSVGIDFYPDWLFDGPVVTSARGTSADALAEFALGAIFAAEKRFPDVWIDDADDWAPSRLGMVRGKTLGIFGFGSVGEALAPRAQALGMDVVALRRGDDPFAVAGVARARDIGDLLARSDHLVLAAPHTAETHHAIDARALASARPGLHIVNIARGQLIDDAALLAALDEGRIGSATLDVAFPEPLPDGHPFYRHPRIRLSPHISVNTDDTGANLANLVAYNLDRFKTGEALYGRVDRARGY